MCLLRQVGRRELGFIGKNRGGRDWSQALLFDKSTSAYGKAVRYLATLSSPDNRDDVQRAIAAGVERVPDETAAAEERPKETHEKPQATTNGKESKQEKPLPRLLSKREFLSVFQPPDYLIDGVLQRRFLYSLTGGTGHAKTAIALLIGQLVASRDQEAMLGTYAMMTKGNVIYFVGGEPRRCPHARNRFGRQAPRRVPRR